MFNEVKRETLDLVRKLGETTAMQISLRTSRTPEAASMALRRYYLQGLLSRRTLRGRLKGYTITERGRERLDWLTAHRE